MKNHMKYALIGCGRISTNHIRAALQNELAITAVCDIEKTHMEELLEKHGLERDKSILRYQDYKKMIEENEIDVASIATESGSHAKIACYCLEKGIPVIIEKPMALSIKDADRIIRSSEKTGAKVSVCHQNRFNIAVQKMRQALEDGRFGKISHGAVTIRWNRGEEYYRQASWRGTWEQDGGALMNQCIHGIDLLRWMMGDEIACVYGAAAQRFHGYLEAEDVGTAVIRFQSGAIATVEGTTNVFPRNLEETLYLFGEKGTVKLGGKSANQIDVWDFRDETQEDAALRGLKEEVGNVYGNGHVRLFADMLEAIRVDRVPYVDAYAGKRALETVLAIYKSQKTKNVVTLPLDDFSTLHMLERV